jgi:hypothetical protein
MLASPAVRAAGDRIGPAVAGLVVCISALFFGNGLSDAPLVWIGGIALVAGAVFLVWAPGQGPAALAFLGALAGLALWCGLSVLWSASPDHSWTTTNRTLVYLGFAALGVLVGPQLERVAGAATAVVAAVCGWALLAKCVPALYADYGRIARLRAPLDDWNMLALVCVAGIALALWAGARSRAGGTVLLYVFVVTLLLTYSRFGVALACVVAAAWVWRESDRVGSIATLVIGGVCGGGVFAVALALNGITSDGQPRHVRAHDGWIFALVLVGVGALVALASRAPLPRRHARTIERAAAVAALAAVLAVVAVSVFKAGTLWHEFTNPVATQTTSTKAHLTQLGSGNRWTWWTEAWRGFKSHPLGGTGAGTFQLTDLRYRQSSDITALEPHNVPLQFLSETGIVGFLLFLGTAAAALWAAVRMRGPLPLLVAAFFVHAVVNYDWNFVAVCGPFLLVAGVLVSQPREARGRRSLLTVAFAVVFALGCVYSLAAPWLAERAQAKATTLAQLQHAHSYDPLNTSIITEEAAFALALDASERYYRQAVSLEPTNPNVWLELATFYAENGAWKDAYAALTKAYRYDPNGPAGQCGLAQQIRRKAGIRATCRGAGLPSIP